MNLDEGIKSLNKKYFPYKFKIEKDFIYPKFRFLKCKLYIQKDNEDNEFQEDDYYKPEIRIIQMHYPLDDYEIIWEDLEVIGIFMYKSMEKYKKNSFDEEWNYKY